MPRSARRNKKARSFRRTLGLLVLVNVVPLVIVAALGVMYARGELEIQLQNQCFYFPFQNETFSADFFHF